MKNCRKNAQKSSNGITLIALVITIIVLLILAGISISMLSGDNSILQKATTAKTETEKGQEKEIVALAYNSALAKKVSISDSTPVTSGDLNIELTNQGASADGDNPIIVTFTKSQNTYTIDSNGNIEKSVPLEPMVAGAKVRDSKGKKVATINTKLVDDYDNKITIPKGFKIAKGENVTDGIVIEDVNAETKATVGNQFVWIPLGSSIKKSETQTIEIKLGRYKFDNNNGIPTLVQEASKTDYTTGIEISVMGNNFYEYDETNTTYGNAKAKSLGSFISSAIDNGGYYIARYEAGINGTVDQYTLAGFKDKSGGYGQKEPTDSTKVLAKDGSIKPIIKSGVGVWNAVTEPEAAMISKNMYANLNSDLINSYAWDTAIVFIQMCGKNTNYSNRIYLEYSTITGNSGDEECNINDMAGNVCEWTTETNASTECPASYRCCRNGAGESAFRGSANIDSIWDDYIGGFRPILYL